MAFMPENAPLVVLSFLGTCFLLGVAGALFLYAWITRKPRFALPALGAALALGGLYVALLLGAAFASRERTLGPGEWKYFCEVDCHVAYAVESVRTAKTLRSPEHPESAGGLFYVVRVKAWFDERTTARRRPRDLALAPGPRLVAVVDGYGNYYAPRQAIGPPLTQPLLPGQSYTVEFVFDLPADRPDFRLFVGSAVPINWLLIGHESSLFHGKVFFALEPATASTGG